MTERRNERRRKTIEGRCEQAICNSFCLNVANVAAENWGKKRRIGETRSRSTQKGIGNDALKGLCERFKEKLNMPGVHAGNKYRECETSRRIGSFNGACIISVPTHT